MSGLKVIFSKELRRVFKDPKMVFSLFILPVIIMVGIYGLMGVLMQKMMADIEEHTSIVYVQNMPEETGNLLDDFWKSCEVTELNGSENMEDLKQQISDGTADLIVVFPEDFMDSVKSYTEGAAIPDIQVFYNPFEDYSDEAWSRFNSVLDDTLRPALLAERIGDLSMIQIFTVNESADGKIFDDQKASGKMLAMLIPYLITMLLFAGTMSLGVDAIAGEKERGTMASMLVTPVKRRDIVLGKLLALTVMSICSAVIYIASMVIAMPQALGLGDMGFAFSPVQVIMVAVLMLFLAFLYVAVVSLVAVFAKTVKEASTYISPIYMVVIVAGMMTMLSPTASHDTWEYIVPVYSSALALGEIFTQELTAAHFFMVSGSTLLLGIVLTGVIVKAFDNEKYMFNA